MTGLTLRVAIPGDAALRLRQRTPLRATKGTLLVKVLFRVICALNRAKRSEANVTSRRRVLVQLDRALVYGTKG